MCAPHGDANVLLPGLLWRGRPYQLFDLALAGKIECYATDALIAELDRVLGYARLAQRIATLNTTTAELVADYGTLVQIVPAANITPTVIDDPDDDHVLACAIAAGAELIASGDARLLNLKRHQDIEIIGIKEAISRTSERYAT